jgi:hypothetical protein
MGSNSFLTRLAIIFFIVAAVIGLVHLGGGDSMRSFFIKMHGGR